MNGDPLPRPVRAAVALLLLSAAAWGCRPPVRAPEEPRGAHFTVLTYNINYGGYRADLGAAAILDSGADVVCLQETSPAWQEFLTPRLAGRYPHRLFRHAPAAGGMAAFSRWPLKEVAWHRPEAGWFHGWRLRAETPAGPVEILSVHLRPQISDQGRVGPGVSQRTGAVRLAEIRELEARLDPALPRLILGDFNEEDGGAALRHLAGRGYTDALAEFDRRSPTWRWRYGIIRLSRRFDHVMYSTGLHACRAAVVPAGASDHFPVVAVFDRPPEPPSP
jgi:vancomycin resistance protein VanJ